MGVQLDASHDIAGSKMKEVTQLISALSQNPDTADRANEMYIVLAETIELAMEPYLKQIKDITPDKLKKLYASLSRDLVRKLSTSDTQGLAKAIAETFEYGKVLPFSNQNFFSSFIKNLVTQMNQDFITRYYPGTGAILTPSHKIIQLLQNAQGEVFTQGDLRVLAINEYKTLNYLITENDGNGGVSEKRPTTEEIIDNYIDIHFPDSSVNADELQLEDSVRIMDDGTEKIVRLNNLDIYYKIKKDYKGKKVTVVHSIARDLKPIEITFTVPTETKNDVGISIPSTKTMNLFDFDSVKLKYGVSPILDVDVEAQFRSQLNIKSNKEYVRKLTI
ncbi:MAG: hypothetical protein ACOH2V_01160 [Candidatus Saccharimonadaceae bacterium]